VINLIENAVKNSPHDSAIELEARREGKDSVFEVTDSGTGIDESEISRLLAGASSDRLRAADSSGGMGIGLSICDSIIKAHEGRLEASNRETGGAVFRFTLPLGECETDER
jgi:two-component system sensor histidine kinase KdpD